MKKKKAKRAGWPAGQGRKLTKEKALAIYKSNGTLESVARKYSISAVMVYYIRTGKRWASTTGHVRIDRP